MAPLILILCVLAQGNPHDHVTRVKKETYHGGVLIQAETDGVTDGIVTWKNGTQQAIHNGVLGKWFPKTWPREGHAKRPQADTTGPITETPDVTPDTGATSTIDTYILISPKQVSAWGGILSATNNAHLAVDRMNQAFLHSGIDAQTRIVGVAQDSVPEDSTMDANLSNLATRSLTGEFDAIRAATGYDQLTKLVTTSSGGVGLGYMYSSNVHFTLTVVQGNASAANMTLAHEMGHNMGLCHNWQGTPTCTPNGPGCNALTAYGYGGSSKFRTVMSYTGGPRTPQWSEAPPAKWFSDGTSAIGNANANATACLTITAPLLAARHATVIPVDPQPTDPHTAPTTLLFTPNGPVAPTHTAPTSLLWSPP